MSPLCQINITWSLNRRKIATNKFTPQSNSRKIAQRSARLHRSHFPSHVQLNSSLRISDQRRWQIPLRLARQSLILQKSYRHSVGPCNITCSSCQALHWIHERSYPSTIHNPLFFTCCQCGQILLPSFPDAPEPLKSLLREHTEGTSTFIMSFC